MVTKSYKCPSCGQIDHECDMNAEALKKCPVCKSKITRIFKSVTYTDCDGFYGKGR